jgi:hypothetical protein
MTRMPLCFQFVHGIRCTFPVASLCDPQVLSAITEGLSWQDHLRGKDTIKTLSQPAFLHRELKAFLEGKVVV